MKTGQLVQCAAACCLSAAVFAQGAVYSWFDAEGNVVYGDQPPEGVTARRIEVPPAPAPQQPLAPSAAVYLWMDQDGHAQYGSEPPPGAVARLLDLPPPEAGPAPAGRPGTVVYTWRDMQGLVHYGSEPPEGVNAVPVDFSRQPVTTIGAGGLRPGELEALRALDPGVPPGQRE